MFRVKAPHERGINASVVREAKRIRREVRARVRDDGLGGHRLLQSGEHVPGEDVVVNELVQVARDDAPKDGPGLFQFLRWPLVCTYAEEEGLEK